MNLLMDYDDLMELCTDSGFRPLTAEESKALSDMYEALMHLERAQWRQVPDELIERINDDLSFDFPMLRFIIGIVPTEDN